MDKYLYYGRSIKKTIFIFFFTSLILNLFVVVVQAVSKQGLNCENVIVPANWIYNFLKNSFVFDNLSVIFMVFLITLLMDTVCGFLLCTFSFVMYTITGRTKTYKLFIILLSVLFFLVAYMPVIIAMIMIIFDIPM